MTLRIYEAWEQARRTVLRRRDVMALDEVPEAVRAGIRRVFGEELPPQEAVARILADVRQRGDEALRDWTARIDGLTLDEIGSFVWRLCDGNHSVREIIRALAARYKLHRKEAEVSVVAYLRTLAKRRLIAVAVPRATKDLSLIHI